ncbi:uncharacterized protein PV09_03262 [Verruconis gallopava]|uniref:SGNH hydrolase-type esterase domain-containing protein n=1 Tax=Verruconis gallopava TaxID=253628 RepID=A0A0D1YZH3_9PEZI|nr:uncharacterized protein PV09_03262 [Verruconis gallopava]KIW06092.1 hypothetical protein PV09_03262 [Verruconis gallopava]
MERIAPLGFYTEWKGHLLADLKRLFANSLVARGDRPVVWLAGDSSLDNKAWISANGSGGVPLPVSVPDIYTMCFKSLTPMKPDVAFWMNHYLGDRATAINAAVEASLLRERSGGFLLPHDRLVRDNIRAQDVLVVSVGANDIALSPTVCTALNMLWLARLSSQEGVEKGTARALSHFKKLFGREVERYVKALVGTTKPAAVVVCMIYYPLEASRFGEPSWADAPLKALKYDTHPQKVQAAIRAIYEQATMKISVPGTKVIPLPLFDVLDGKTPEDYVERVEPSVQGGRKMSQMLTKLILPLLDEAERAREDTSQRLSEDAVN